MNARDGILGRIRKANAHRPRGNGVAPHPIPAIARGSRNDLVARFIARAESVGATVERVPSYVRGGMDDAYVVGESPGPLTAQHKVAITPVIAGIAETGSLLVASGPRRPQLAHFLPETHIAVLPVDRIVGSYEEGYALVRDEAARTHNGVLPRAITLITGPSRTSDIERTLQIGVHGPRRLHIILTG